MNIIASNPDLVLNQIDTMRQAAESTPLYIDAEKEIENPIFKKYSDLINKAVTCTQIMARAKEVGHPISNIQFAAPS